MAHTIYDNFYLSNEVEDQFNSHLDMMRFCTVDDTLEGTDGMKRLINVYTATEGTEKLGMGEGNSKSIEVGHTQREYNIELAQNRFDWHDEEAMKDPMLVPVGMQRAGTDMFNTVNGDLFGELEKATLHVDVSAYSFDAFADAGAVLNVENTKVSSGDIGNYPSGMNQTFTLKLVGDQDTGTAFGCEWMNCTDRVTVIFHRIIPICCNAACGGFKTFIHL